MAKPIADSTLSVAQLKGKLLYDPSSGDFTRLTTQGRWLAGTIAGCLKPDGYLCIYINKRLYLAHRLAWFYVHGSWPIGDLDHINGNRMDNRLCNLREASRTGNNRNAKNKGARSGFKGVQRNRFATIKPSWVACITVDYKAIHLGCFPTPEAAYEAYTAAARMHFGEFARIE